MGHIHLSVIRKAYREEISNQALNYDLLDDDNLWNEFYNNINADLVKKGE